MSRARSAVKVVTAKNGNHIGKTFTGRTGWALEALCDKGGQGLRRIDHAATSLPYYIHRIREALGGDESVTTDRVNHGGEFSGRHAVYRLADLTMRVEKCAPPEKKKPATAGRVSNSKSNGESGSFECTH